MKKIYKIAFIVLLTAFCFNNRVHASHLMGGEITWTCLGQDSFMIKMVIYRDCNGITLGVTPINFACAATGTSITSLNLSVGTPVDITPVCISTCTRCQSSACSFPYGIHRYTMSGIVVLSGAGTCCNIRISWSQNARSSSITTSTGAGTADLYIEALLNRCLNPCDNSPSFTNAPVAILCMSQDFNLNHGVVDVDLDSTGGLADSLTYEWAEPLSAANTPIPYLGSYDYDKAIYFWGFPNAALPFPRGIHLDPHTGDIQFRPMKAEVTIMVVKINEFRNGTKIAEIRRDLEIMVISCVNNNPPTLSTPNGIKSKTVCVGDTVSFTYSTSDPNSNDTVRINWNNNISGATWSDNNGQVKHPTATFKWAPLASQVSQKPYTFMVTAKDNSCPISGQAFQMYEVIVKANIAGNYTVTDSGCGKYQFNATAILDTGAKFIWGGSVNDTVPNFSHYFTQSGRYPFSFTILSSYYCRDTIYDTLQSADFLWIKVPNDTFICYGSTLNLNVQAFNPKGNIRYKWNTGDTVASITVSPLTSTWYKVDVSDSLSCPDRDSVLIQVSPAVKVNNDTIVCKWQSLTLSATAGFQSYKWNTSETSRSITKIITAPYWYKVVATYNGNCSTSDSVFVNIHPATSVYAGADTSICSSNGVLKLNGLPDASAGGTGFWTGTSVFQDASKKWYFIPASSSVINHATYQLTYSYTDTYGCLFSDALSLKVYKYTVLTGTYSNMCINANQITLNGNPVGGYWQGNGISGIKFDPKTAGAGSHRLIYSINDYCLFSDTTYISVYPIPNVQLNTYNGQTEFCPTEGLIALIASPTGGQWSGDVETTQTFNTSRIDGNYSIRYFVKDNHNCNSADTIFLKVRLPNITIEKNQKDVCYGNSILLKAKSYFPKKIIWSKDTSSNGYFNGNTDSNQLYFVPGLKDYTNGGTWIRVKTVSMVCNVATDSIYIRAGFFPKTEFLADLLTGKIPLQVSFTDLSTIQHGNITGFNWEFGDTGFSNIQNPVHTYLNTGSYDVKLTTVSDIGCKDSLIKQNYIATTLSIDEDKNAVYTTLYPNPASSYVEVSFTDKRYKILQLFIYNASGTMILQQNGINQNSLRIDTYNLKSGLYLLRVVSDKGKEYLAKFTKE